jgi:hypothetical protein
MGQGPAARFKALKEPIIWIAMLQHIREVNEVKRIIHKSSTTSAPTCMMSVGLAAVRATSETDFNLFMRPTLGLQGPDMREFPLVFDTHDGKP